MLAALAFVPLSDVVDAFEELIDNDDLPQDIVSYFETHHIGGVRGRGRYRRRVAPTFPMVLWNVFERTVNNSHSFHFFKYCDELPSF